ncbi:MAG TPA: NAD-dependent epimerase/dehydratase family protein [Thermoanaerobaculia bacterium]|nr:NAD-dependent epimerase/dehydratase family protein [Thermoanaerobaculia bacterium]
MKELEDVVRAFPVSRCLVTGGAGFIGSNLTRSLLAAGCEVTVLDDLSTGKREHLPAAERLTVVEGDLCTMADLPVLVRRADYVFHLAAQVGNVRSLNETERDAATNVLGSVRLLCACREVGVRKLVYSSSSATFGEAERLPIDEAHSQSPASFYALSKLTAERYTRLAAELWGLPAVSLRYFNVFGLPMEDSEYTGVISIFFNRLRAGEPLIIYGDGEQVRDFVHVGDVVQANLLAALHGRPGGVYNIGTGVSTNVCQLAEAMIEIAGRSTEITHRDARAGEVRRSLADISLASGELGYRPLFDLRRGLVEMWRSLG